MSESTGSTPAQSNGDNSGSPPDLIPDVIENGETDSNGDDSPSVIELSSDEFPSYFIERHGRLFHSTSAPYPLPVDTPEQERNTFLHEALKQLHGANYIGPVSDALSPDPQREKRVLDACTGNGIWVLEMAAEFPQIYFIGFDHVPIATRYPPSNVRFEIEDVNAPYRWSDESFDLVHTRATAQAVRDYHAVLQEMARVLRPGGLFISSEWEHQISLPPSSSQDGNINISTHAPASCHFFDAVNNALSSRHRTNPIGPHIASLLSTSGFFVEISARTYYIPIGTWPEDPSLKLAGETNLKAQERYADSVKVLLLDAGLSEPDIDVLVADYVQELRSVDGLVSVLHTVHAKKV